MGLLDKLLEKKGVMKQLEAMMGGGNVMEILKSLTGNKDFMTKLAGAKDENEVQHLIASAVDALKDKKLTDAEKKELTNQLKNLAGGMLGKK